MKQIKKQQNGFTLLEILIALVIFAILGIIVAVGFRRSLLSNKHVGEADKRIQKLEITQALLRRDISQTINRSILDRNGEKLPAIQLKPNALEFTRAGVINPLGINKQSDMQRIEYTYKNNTIVRIAWPVLDRAANSAPSSMNLLTHVTHFNIQVYDNKNNLQSAWPASNSTSIHTNSGDQSALPKAVKITFSVKGQGIIEDIIPIPSQQIITQRVTPHAQASTKS